MTRSWMLLVLPLIGAFGCHYDSDGDYYEDDWPVTCGTVERGVIDRDAPLDSEAGIGVGFHVEYQEGGRWYFYSTCDTEDSDFECYFDAVVTPVGSATVEGVFPDALERSDSLELVGGDSVRFFARTDVDIDGFYLDSQPGAALRIDLLLDEACGNEYLYWIGDGAIHQGAPSNPFELEPLEP